MIVDSSALIAIIEREEDADALSDILLATPTPRISAANWFEAAMVAEGRGGAAGALAFDDLVEAAGLQVEAVSPEQARLARDAWRIWGKRNHVARLNFGDCFAYALARSRGEPLLFKGDDFSKTDIKAAL